VERIESAAWGSPVRPEDIVASVHRNPPKLVAIVHADTSTGILQPLAAVGNACRETGTLFMVDAVLSLGGCQLDVDGWRVDAAVGGMQKCLGGPPGLAPLTCSERALDARTRRSTLPHSVYLDLARLQAQWIGRQGLETAAMSTSMLLAAREALRIVVDEGLEARWQRHRQASGALRAGLEALGLE